MGSPFRAVNMVPYISERISPYDRILSWSPTDSVNHKVIVFVFEPCTSSMHKCDEIWTDLTTFKLYRLGYGWLGYSLLEVREI